MSLAPEHPLLDLGVLSVRYPAPLGELATPEAVLAVLAGPEAPPAADEGLRTAVRTMLRHDGFRPAGRNKPASEYLVKAASDGRLGAINVAVDLGNAASLLHGLPVSVVDLDRAREPLSVRVADAGAEFVFNASGQVIDVGGLLCLHDAEGPCANAVKDCQRTKTDAGTTRTLSLVWGIKGEPERTAALLAWYGEQVRALGGEVGG